MYRIVRVSPQEGHIGVGFSIDETREKITKTKQAKAETEEALKKWDEWLKPKEPTTREQFETTELQYWYRRFYGNKDDLHSQRTVIDRIDGSAFQKLEGFVWDDKKNGYVDGINFHRWAGVCKLFDKRKHVKF